MLKKKRILFVLAFVVLLMIICVSFCVGFSNENNNELLETQKSGQIFSDIKESDWFYSDIKYINEKGLMQGTNDNLFSPDMPTTRGMLVTILWRLDGEPVENVNTFFDVKSDTYYYNAVAWASKYGIVSGYTENAFSPDDNITREQLASIIYRYASYKEYDISQMSSLDEYIDKNQISDYAVSAMQWANANGIIKGISEETLAPQGYALRCQIAAILRRLCTQIMSADPVIGADDISKTEHPDKEHLNNEDDEITMGSSNIGGSISSGGTSNIPSESENNAESNGYPIITVSGISGKPKDTVLVSVILNNNPGVLGMALTAYYDETNLTLQSVENGEAFRDILDLTPSKTLNSGARFLWDGIDISQDKVKDGTILLMKFKINDNAQEDTYPITLKYSDGDIVDKNLEDVSPQIETGYITITQR